MSKAKMGIAYSYQPQETISEVHRKRLATADIGVRQWMKAIHSVHGVSVSTLFQNI